MYYQVPTSDTFGQVCCVRLGRKILKPSVLPIGCKHACGIAQAITWGVILHEKNGDHILSVEDNIRERSDVPGSMQLPTGGLTNKLINDAAHHLNTRTWTMHSLRHGKATELRVRGVPISERQLMGRWRSHSSEQSNVTAYQRQGSPTPRN